MSKDDFGPEWGHFSKADPASYVRKRKVRRTTKRRPSPESLGVGTRPPIREQGVVEETGPSIGSVKRTVRLMALASEFPDVAAIERRLIRKYGESPTKITIYGIVREFEQTLKLLVDKGVASERALRTYRNRE